MEVGKNKSKFISLYHHGRRGDNDLHAFFSHISHSSTYRLPPPEPCLLSRCSQLLSQSSTLVETPSSSHSHSHSHPSALLALTPELLLQIISHLPTASYHPLTRTSHGLRLFFKIHAAHICNTHITQHFALEARLLKSTIRDGWLVPTHQSVRTNLSSTSLPKTEELRVLSEPGTSFALE